MRVFSEKDIESLALGAALLGSGGGGNPFNAMMVTEHQIHQYGPVDIIKPTDLADDDLIVPIGFMGAPLISLERIPHTRELESVIAAIEKDYGRKLKALTITEIGGSNAFTPFYIAGKLGLPIVDADLIGRAFPELQMITTTVHNVKPDACYMADIFGNTIKLNCADLHAVEKYARQLTVAFGSSAAIALHVFSGASVKKVMIAGSISKACAIGHAILNARAQRLNVVEAVLAITHGRHLGEGVIIDIDQTIRDGFLNGHVIIQKTQDCHWQIKYQNEYLFVYENAKRMAATPDIIAIIDKDSGMPITSESMHYGLRVEIIAMPGPDIWYTEEGMQLVGPSRFMESESL